MVGGESFYDFGYGNETGYYDVTRMNNGVPCSGLEGPGAVLAGQDSRDPASICYTGAYATDVFVGRARQVSYSPAYSFILCRDLISFVTRICSLVDRTAF